MRLVERFPLHAWALALVPCAALQDDDPQDTLYLRDGSTELGTVLEESLAGLSFQPERGAKKVVAWDAIQTIEYPDAPEELATGLITLGAGNLQSALEQFQTVLATEEMRPMIVQQALFYLAYAQQQLGQVDGALASYAKLFEDFPRSRYLQQAAENVIELHLQKGDAAAAEKLLGDLERGAKDAEGAETVLGLLQARLLEGQGKQAEAREKYAAVEGLAGAAPSLVQEAKLGRARMLLAEGKAAETEPLLRGLVMESQNPRVQSGAWNGLGEIALADGRARKNGDRILEALYAHLRTVVQYKPLPGESTAEYERALSGSATCFKYLSELEQNTEKKKLLRDRERERDEQLKREFPNSAFLKK